MSRLLTLYPGAWRARYGDEVEALLASRPPDLSDRLDLVRGAIDARLNPQRPGSSLNAPAAPADRAIGVLAMGAGTLLTVWAATIVLFVRPWGVGSELGPWEDLASSTGFWGALLGAVAVLAIVLRHGFRIGDLGVLGGFAILLGIVLAYVGPVAVAILGYGTLLLARGIGGRIVSTASATLFVAASFVAISGLVAFFSSGQDLRALWLLLPYGPGWLVLGLGIFRHRTEPVADGGPAASTAR